MISVNFFGSLMTDNIKILSSLIIGPLTIPATASAHPVAQERTIPPTGGFKSSSLRKIRFDYAYQPNLMAIHKAEVPMGKYVGELQEKWQFPSDHLPIGMTIDGLHIASWNVLNSEYMDWVFKNSQGLSRSQLADEHIYLEGSKLTFRDMHVIGCIKSMLEHPTHPRSVISLQECSTAFIRELRIQLEGCGRLPTKYSVIQTTLDQVKDQNIIIYDRRVLAYDPDRSTVAEGIFSKDEKKSAINLCFTRRDTQETWRIVNTHLPGEPGNPAPAEFATYVASLSSPNEVTIAMGDMNFNEVEMRDAFTKRLPNGFQFNLFAPYCTNIEPLTFNSKSIDHFFVLAKHQYHMSANTPEEVMPGLDEIVNLLDSASPLVEIK